jgi:lactoylglutathione lyase
MKIEHLAIWGNDVEAIPTFYKAYFRANAGNKYHNPITNYTSYFLSLTKESRLELMYKPTINLFSHSKTRNTRPFHFSIAVGTKKKVEILTERIRTDGIKILGEPRTMGDGYYESVILDPEGNQIEFTI